MFRSPLSRSVARSCAARTRGVEGCVFASLTFVRSLARRSHTAKVPKAASSTLFDLVYVLAPRNRFAVDSRPMYPAGGGGANEPRAEDARAINASAREYARWYAARAPRTVHTAHGTARLDVGALV